MSHALRGEAINDDLRWACERFLGEEVEVDISGTEGGVNNIVRKITITREGRCEPDDGDNRTPASPQTKVFPAGSQFIVRVYNTNDDSASSPSSSSTASKEGASAWPSIAKVLFEHTALKHVGSYHNHFDWKAPVPMTTLSDGRRRRRRCSNFSKDDDGKKFSSLSSEIVRLPKSGLLASMFPLLPGALPMNAMAAVKPISRASGELSVILSRMNLSEVGKSLAEKINIFRDDNVGDSSRSSETTTAAKKYSYLTPTPPYYDLYRAHECMSKERYHAFMEESPLLLKSNDAVVRENSEYVVAEMLKLEETVSKLHKLGLPRQAIHGDLHYDNVLAIKTKKGVKIDNEGAVGEGDGNDDNSSSTSFQVTALLDFEFVAYDWRAMELAICLSKYISEPNPLPYVRQFIAGWREGVESASAKFEKVFSSPNPLLPSSLSSAEVEALSSLVKLRILSNTVFFIGRAIAGEDSIESLTSRLGTYVKRLKWLDANDAAIKACFE